MTMSQVLLSYDDAMYYRLLTNPFGSGDASSTSGAPGGSVGGPTVAQASSIEEISMKHRVRRATGRIGDYDPKIQEMFRNMN